jgi:ribosomal protein L11 methyltransferase
MTPRPPRLRRAEAPADDLYSLRIFIPPGAPADSLAKVEAALAPLALALTIFSPDSGDWRIEVLVQGFPEQAMIDAAVNAVPVSGGLPAMAAVRRVPRQDWVAESERAQPAMKIGRFFVYGSHIKTKPPRGSVPLLIDGGLAFGTGRHESTAGCLLALDELARRRRFRRPLDLGCGSGILAIAMAKLWNVSVLAVDNDPQAVTVARENAARNGVAHLVRVMRGGGYGAPAVKAEAPFDLVTANILARPLMRLAPGLARSLAPGGRAVLAGLLESQEQMVMAAQARAGLGLVEARVKNGWLVLLLKRGRVGKKAAGKKPTKSKRRSRGVDRRF